MLLRHGLLVLAAAAGVAGAGIAVRAGDDTASATSPISSALPLSRRSDPSTDRYTRTRKPTTPVSRMTDAQQWISAHTAPFVAYDSDPTVSLNMVGWATKPDVHAYVNAAGPNAYNQEAVRDASKYLIRKGKSIVHVDGWDVIDIRNPAARHFWLYGADNHVSCTPDRNRRAALDLIACGYTGLWVDDILTQPAQWYKPNPGIDAAAWGNAEVALLQELRAALPAGVPFTINAHWTDTTFPYAPHPALDPANALVRAAQVADQIVIEGGAIDPGINYSGGLDDAWSYPRLLAYADALHGGGSHIQWEKTDSTALTSNAVLQLGRTPSCLDRDYSHEPGWKQGSGAWRAHVRTAAFNLATALLTFVPGDSVGDMCEYPGRGFRGYGQDLGAPLGIRADVGGVVVRAFEGGTVAVNPSSSTQTVTLPPGRSGVNLASTSVKPTPAASAFTLGPRTALIAQYTP